MHIVCYPESISSLKMLSPELITHGVLPFKEFEKKQYFLRIYKNFHV